MPNLNDWVVHSKPLGAVVVSAKPKQQEIVAELAKLRKRHVEALAKSTFGGFTSTEEAAYQERVKRTASLVQQLGALDETSE